MMKNNLNQQKPMKALNEGMGFSHLKKLLYLSLIILHYMGMDVLKEFSSKTTRSFYGKNTWNDSSNQLGCCISLFLTVPNN